MFDSIQTGVNTAMRDVVSVLQVPVVVLLLIGLVFTALCIGWLIVEIFTERRHFNIYLPRLIDTLNETRTRDAEGTRQAIVQSGLLLRQKRVLLELTQHPQLTPEMRESMAVDLEYRERRHYDGITKITDMLAKVAPMLGLLGTLIPLGPGIMALSSGDTATLSASLLTAFDTTSLGLVCACVALIISAVRKRWYKTYMVAFDAVMECVLEVEKLRDAQVSERPVYDKKSSKSGDSEALLSLDANMSHTATDARRQGGEGYGRAPQGAPAGESGSDRVHSPSPKRRSKDRSGACAPDLDWAGGAI